MLFTPRVLRFVLALFVAMVLWMGYDYWFQTDHQGHRLSQVGTPEAQAAGQRLLGRADALMQQQRFDDARQLLDSLRDAELNPHMHIEEDAIRARYDSLYQHRSRAGQP